MLFQRSGIDSHLVVLGSHDGEAFWRWCFLEMQLPAVRSSKIRQKQFTIIIHSGAFIVNFENVNVAWGDVFSTLPSICRSSNRRCSIKKVFLKLLQNSQEITCARVSFLIKLQASGKSFKSNFFIDHLRTNASASMNELSSENS